MPKRFDVILTSRAHKNILECIEFVKKVSDDVAVNLYKEFIEKIESLSSFPNRCKKVKGLKFKTEPVRKMLVNNGRYLILYFVKKNKVTILTVLDSRRENKFLKLL